MYKESIVNQNQNSIKYYIIYSIGVYYFVNDEFISPKCKWFNNILNIETKVDNKYGVIQLKQ